MNFKQRSEQLKTDLHAAIVPLIHQFHTETGVLPTSLTVLAIDVSNHSEREKYILGPVRLEFKL